MEETFDECGPTVSGYSNSRYQYDVKAPSGWRLATNITSATNPSIRLDNAEFVYFTRLSCANELQVSGAVAKDNPFWGGQPVQAELNAGNLIVVYANVSDGGLDFALQASKITLRNTNVHPASNVSREMLPSGINAVRYELRNSTDTLPYETVFVPAQRPIQNAFGYPVKGFTIQVGMGNFFSEESFSSFYRSFGYSR